MLADQDILDLDDALRRAGAGTRALSIARERAEDGSIYATHLQLAAIELAHAIELALKVALRNP